MDVQDFLKRDLSRRQFLGRSAQNAAGVAAGMVGFSEAVAQVGANDRISIGVIGVRNRGKVLAQQLATLADVDVAALCDIDDRLPPIAAKTVDDARLAAGLEARPAVRCSDFRRILDDKSVDAVVIATPDHWHALMTLMACQAGKDVYVEKPVSHNIAEGQKMVAAVQATDQIVQAGLQQRSLSHFQTAIELVRSGEIGQVRLAKAWTVHRRKPIERKPDTEVPANVNYDLWLGPAPNRAFNANRFHHNWQWFWDYGTGELGNWGVHMLDVARWGLEVELPTAVASTGGNYCLDDERDTPDTQIVQFSYPDKTIVWEHRLWSTHGIEGRSAAAAFYGERGTLIVDRSGWKVYDRKEALTEAAADAATVHVRNFVDCIKTRSTPTADLPTAHTSAALCHLGNIAHRLKREIRFRRDAMDFGDDTEANAMLGREYREPWAMPSV
jgi:predicted dehydrogenase